jgi:5-methylcytosine-specific restriction endonuclease McrA
VCVESAATGHVDGARPTDRAHDTLDRAHVGSGACSAERLHVCVECAATDNIDDARALTDRAIGTLHHAQVGAPDPIEVDRGSARAKGGTRRLGSDAQRGRAKYQIAVVVCETCRRGWQEGGGKRIPITVEDVARAECDAQWVGSLDGEPGSAAQDIAPKTRRFVWHRDGGRCTVPGCRASSFLEVHHIVHREHGGGNEAENLTLLCGGHHDAHHAGRLVIRGRAPNLRFELAGERLKPTRAHVDALPERAEMRADAVLALHTLGFKKPEAVAAVDAALAARSPPSDLETLLRLALRYCPR